MSRRVGTLAPLALALALLAVTLFLPDAAAQKALIRQGVLVAKLLAAAAALAAALAFERGDYLRRAWALVSINMFLLARQAVLGSASSGGTILGVSRASIHQGIVLVANLAFVYATWLMARAFRVAGIELPWSRARRTAWFAAGVVLALVVAGALLAHDVKAALRGGPVEVIAIISGTADVISLSLIAPVLLTVLAMRGGILAWPWGLYAASLLCWLFYDGGEALLRIDALGGIAPELHMLKESMRLLACAFVCSAGLAQRSAVLTIRNAVPAEP